MSIHGKMSVHGHFCYKGTAILYIGKSYFSIGNSRAKISGQLSFGLPLCNRGGNETEWGASPREQVTVKPRTG